MSRPPAVFFCLIRVVFYFDCFVILNKVERDLVFFFAVVFKGIHDTADKDEF